MSTRGRQGGGETAPGSDTVSMEENKSKEDDDAGVGDPDCVITQWTVDPKKVKTVRLKMEKAGSIPIYSIVKKEEEEGATPGAASSAQPAAAAATGQETAAPKTPPRAKPMPPPPPPPTKRRHSTKKHPRKDGDGGGE